MAAKLVWREGGLYLGGWLLAGVRCVTPKLWIARMTVDGPTLIVGEMWETEEDAMQDLEREVRRLLREAGAEVEP